MRARALSVSAPLAAITKLLSDVYVWQNRGTAIKRNVSNGFVSGAFSLLQLDLSANFLQEFPTDALRHLTDLKFLNISNNLITVSTIADHDHVVHSLLA